MCNSRQSPRSMDIGKERRTVIVEPIKSPVPPKEPARPTQPKEVPAERPERVPERV